MRKHALAIPKVYRRFFDSAARKHRTISKKPFKQNWAYLQTMLRLIRAYHRREYDQVSDDALVWIIAALNYLVDPFDLIRTTFRFSVWSMMHMWSNL